MRPLSRRHFLHGACCSCAALALSACASDASSPPITGALAPGYHPASATDEGGLWQVMDQAEGDLKKSRKLIRDPEVTGYLHDIVCRLGAEHCPDIRVYLVRTPYFNASMAANGMMQVWSGLLLRMDNEAQLAAILGHEMGHYLKRHTLAKMRHMEDTASLAAFLGLGLAVAGGGGLVDLTNAMALANIFAFSRDQEREADEVGIELMTKAGYKATEAARVWEQLIAEQKADKEQDVGNVLFATHPAPEERMATLRQRGVELTKDGQQDGADALRTQLRGLRKMMLDDELALRQFPKTLVLLDRLSHEMPPDGDILNAYGDLYLLRDDSGDLDRARDSYEKATELADAPADAWRGLGLVLRRQGDQAQAVQAFQTYLKKAGDVPDRALIQSYISGAA